MVVARTSQQIWLVAGHTPRFPIAYSVTTWPFEIEAEDVDGDNDEAGEGGADDHAHRHVQQHQRREEEEREASGYKAEHRRHSAFSYSIAF